MMLMVLCFLQSTGGISCRQIWRVEVRHARARRPDSTNAADNFVRCGYIFCSGTLAADCVVRRATWWAELLASATVRRRSVCLSKPGRAAAAAASKYSPVMVLRLTYVSRREATDTAQRNETETKQFQNSFRTALKLF